MESYRINQFDVTSNLPLPCIPVTPSDSDDAATFRLSVHYRQNVLDEFPSVYWIGGRGGATFLRSYDVGSGILVCMGGDVKMHVDNAGTQIEFDYDSTHLMNRAVAVALTINLGMSLCTLLQGSVPIHGAGLEVDDKLIGIMAPSGTGKSTLMWALLDTGARFASDDVLMAHAVNDAVMVTPSVSLPSKLSRYALERQGMDYTQFDEVLPGEDEYWIPMPFEKRVVDPFPLHALFVLKPFNRPEVSGQIISHKLPPEQAISVLLENTQGLWASYTKLNARQMFAQFAAIARSVPCYVLNYHRRFDMLPHLAHFIREIVRERPTAG